ncbi:MAG: DUF2730 family protein [Sneathiella sp.]|nr:DUF2730 family protein [Sneathiella sp.]
MSAQSISTLEWTAIAQVFVNCAIAIYAWQATKHKASLTQIDTLKGRLNKRLDDHSKRLTKLEIDQHHFPTDKDIGELAYDIRALEGSLKAVTAEMEGMKDISKILRHQIETMDDYLRKLPS